MENEYVYRKMPKICKVHVVLRLGPLYSYQLSGNVFLSISVSLFSREFEFGNLGIKCLAVISKCLATIFRHSGMVCESTFARDFSLGSKKDKLYIV